MTSETQDEIRRRMSEAVLLPPSDPLRQSVVERVAAADGALEREWLELVQEDERLRVELARVRPPPPDLHRRLLDIPAQAQPNAPVSGTRWWVAAVVVGAVILAAIIGMLAVMR